jgi:hypothetical protein
MPGSSLPDQFWKQPTASISIILSSQVCAPSTILGGSPQSSTTPTMEDIITQEAIDAARNEFLRRIDEAALVETDDVVEIGHAVIARNVTIAQLRTVPIQWFDGVRIALLTDNSLVITDVDTRVRTAVVNALARQFEANGLLVMRRQRIRLPDGSIVTPSLQVGVRANPYAPPAPDSDEEPDQTGPHE